MCVCVCVTVGCPFARRAWMTMIEKGIPHTVVTVPLSGQLKAYQAGRGLDTMKPVMVGSAGPAEIDERSRVAHNA